jgi:predicted RNase H-like nuclease (RuvC/YqgF family)
MQMQMNNAKPGSGQCSKPGGSSSKPSPGDMKKLQEQLGKDLKKTAEELKNGKGGSGMSKQLAEMAERQAAIRSALRKLKEQMSQQQKKDTGIDQIMDQMDKIESDIVNKRITPETLKRQKEIENKMLELETAMREQDEDDTRKSNSAQEVPRQAPAELSEFLRRKKAAIDMYQAAPPELKPFYKKLVDKYFDTIAP